MSSTYWSFRLTLGDRPGHLARVAHAVAEVGADVLDVEVVWRADGAITDDLVLELPYWLEPAHIERRLVAAGGDEVTGRRIAAHEWVDRQARAAEVACSPAPSP